MPKRAKVLVVDDDEVAACVLQAALEQDHDVVCVARGDLVLQALAHRPADLVILDVSMPGLDGYDTCREIRKDATHDSVPVVFHSAHADLDERLRGYEVGGDDFLVKPFETPELRAKLARLLAQRQRELDRQQAHAGQIDELTTAVLASADMVGEAGVILDLQRSLMSCEDSAAIASALMQALGRYGLEGCAQVSGRLGSVACSSRASECSALEMSLLDHLAATEGGPNIRPMGAHTGFRYGGVQLFVRDLCMARPDEMDRALAERMGRQIDNVAIMIEGALSRLSVLDAQRAASDLTATHTLMGIARETLADISARGHAQRMQTRGVFEHLASCQEEAFLNLGLTEAQEDFLSEMVRTHHQQVMDVLEDSQDLEARLEEVIRALTPRTG